MYTRRCGPFARNTAFSFPSTWAKVNHHLDVLLNASIVCNAIIVLPGAFYIVSAIGILIGVIIFQYLSYLIPIVLLLTRGRYASHRVLIPRVIRIIL